MSTATIERPSKEAEERIFKILQKDLQLVETARAQFDITLPVGVPFEAALKPEFWSNVAHLFAKQPGDIRDRTGSVIGIGSADHAFYGQVYVRAVRQQALVVETLMQPVYFGPRDVKDNASYKTRWNVGAKGFDIIRLSDSEIVGHAKDFRIREDALAYIEDVLKS